MAASFFSISVTSSKILAGVIAALKNMDAPVRQRIREFTRSEITPDWQKDLAERASRPVDFAVLVSTARTRVSDQNVSLQSATVGKSLRGGLNPKTDYAWIEFGVNDREKVSTYQRRTRKARTQTVTRHTSRQLPPRYRKGRVVYPTAQKEIVQYASLWVQTVIRTFYEELTKAGAK
jgi:hypothetical protein